jgi:hypothetical protein
MHYNQNITSKAGDVTGTKKYYFIIRRSNNEAHCIIHVYNYNLCSFYFL